MNINISMNEIESLSSKLRLSEINSVFGMELSRKIEVEPICKLKYMKVPKNNCSTEFFFPF